MPDRHFISRARDGSGSYECMLKVTIPVKVVKGARAGPVLHLW